MLASLPFVAGFTAVFVALGAAVAAAGSLFLDNRELFLAVAGLVVVVLGFAMMGLLPLPYLDRLAAPGLVQSASKTGSAALLGGRVRALRRPVHRPRPRRDPRARGRRPDRRGGDDPAPHLLGRPRAAVPRRRRGLRARDGRVAAGCATATRCMRVVGGALLVALGLMLFFDRFWWLNVAVNRFFEFFGIGV